MNTQLNNLLTQYGADHQNKINITLHNICVPLIYWAISAVLWVLPPFIELPFGLSSTCMLVFLTFLVSYYLTLSLSSFIVMLAFTLLCFIINMAVIVLSLPITSIALAVFILAWIGQFAGHIYEGRKPSFFTELQFLFIGPLWVLMPLAGYKFSRPES